MQFRASKMTKIRDIAFTEGNCFGAHSRRAVVTAKGGKVVSRAKQVQCLSRHVKLDGVLPAPFEGELHVIVASDENSIIVFVFVVKSKWSIVFANTAKSNLLLDFFGQGRKSDVGGNPDDKEVLATISNERQKQATYVDKVHFAHHERAPATVTASLPRYGQATACNTVAIGRDRGVTRGL